MLNIASNRWYYAKTAEDFIFDAQKDGYIAELLEARYKQVWGREPDLNLLRSWHASPPMLAAAMEKGFVTKDQIVILEYQIDTNNRADAVVCGYYKDRPNAIVVETKQWNEEHSIRSSEDPEMIEMQFGKKWIQMEHPSVQAKRYRDRMRQILLTHQLNINVEAYAYLHNCEYLSPDQLSVLRGKKFGEIFNEVPIYTTLHAQSLGNRIRHQTENGHGIDILKKLASL